jgi:hypothetical protein
MTPMSLNSSQTAPARSAATAFLLVSLNLQMASGAYAQVADVVKPASDGDFRSIKISGYRGSYSQRFWLVLDRDPRGLSCRDGQGRAYMTLKYGSLIETDLTEGVSPLAFLQGKSYLRIRIQPIDILHDARIRPQGTSTVCTIRANTSFIAPVNADSLGLICRTSRMCEVRLAPGCSLKSSDDADSSNPITP